MRPCGRPAHFWSCCHCRRNRAVSRAVAVVTSRIAGRCHVVIAADAVTDIPCLVDDLLRLTYDNARVASLTDWMISANERTHSSSSSRERSCPMLLVTCWYEWLFAVLWLVTLRCWSDDTSLCKSMITYFITAAKRYDVRTYEQLTSDTYTVFQKTWCRTFLQ